MEASGVLLADFGGQYSQLIARRLRELGAHARLVPAHKAAEEAQRLRPSALVLTGGPASVYEPGAPSLPKELMDLELPTIGICYGMQLLAHALGGEVREAAHGEYGRANLEVQEPGALLAGLPEQQICWMSHRDAVYSPPTGAQALAATPASPVAVFEHQQRRLWGIQFHPEVGHSPYGMAALERWLELAGVERSWTAANILDQQVEAIRAQVGSEQVICGLSGGVDSSVAALLVHRAIGDQLTCVLVDHGLLRHQEAEQVKLAFAEQFGVELRVVDASERFLSALAGVTEPEAKRKIIGREFIEAFAQEAAQLSDARFLVQGTLYSDVIESGGAHGSAVIKSHHNVGGLPEDLSFELIEPLRDLFKDEVRKVGMELGLSERMVNRQPFPGPGLGIRVVGGEITVEKLDTLREADRILQEEIRAAGLYDQLWQSFCVLPDVRTVGVQGDARTYGWPIAIRAVTSEDAMTADWARLPYDLLEQIANRMINQIPEVGRVVLDITSKPPGTIEWE